MQQKRHYISGNVVVNWKLSLIFLGYSYIWKSNFEFSIHWTELFSLPLHFYSYLWHIQLLFRTLQMTKCLQNKLVDQQCSWTAGQPSHSGNVNIWLSCHWMEGIFRLTFCHPSTAKITWLLVSCRFKANFWGKIREARNRVIQKNPSFTVPPPKVVLPMHHLGSSYCHVLIVPREYSEAWIKDEGITVKNMKQ